MALGTGVYNLKNEDLPGKLRQENSQFKANPGSLFVPRTPHLFPESVIHLIYSRNVYTCRRLFRTAVLPLHFAVHDH